MSSFFIKNTEMNIFEEHKLKAQKLTPELISKELFRFIKSLSKELIELNKKQLNEDSQDIYGDAIGFYSYATELITKGAKKKGEPFDAKDTGGFLNNFYMTVYDDVFYFGSTDPKTDDILDSPNWLSQELFGLTDENLEMSIETKFKPFIIDYCKKTLLG